MVNNEHQAIWRRGKWQVTPTNCDASATCRKAERRQRSSHSSVRIFSISTAAQPRASHPLTSSAFRLQHCLELSPDLSPLQWMLILTFSGRGVFAAVCFFPSSRFYLRKTYESPGSTNPPHIWSSFANYLVTSSSHESSWELASKLGPKL